MAKTRACDRIRLANGDVMTLGEAIGKNRVTLVAVEAWTRNTDIPHKVTRYYAREGDELWDINQKLYESRQ